MDINELKRFDFSGLEGTGWIERVNPENPRLIDFILRTNIGEMMKNRMFSLDMPPIFSEASFESRMNAITDLTTLVSNKLFEIPLLVKLPLKIFGVKTTNRMEAHCFLERFIVKTPVILPSFITLQKASTDSCYSSGDDNKKTNRHEFKFKILPERCRKTNVNLVKLFSKTSSTPFEELVDKKGSDGFVASKSKKVRKSTTFERSAAAAAAKPVGYAVSTPTRKNAFLKGGGTSKEGVVLKTKTPKQSKMTPSSVSPSGCLIIQSQSQSPTTSLGSSLSISKFPTVISSESCSSSDLKRVPPVKKLPPLPLLPRRRRKLLK